MSQLLHAVGGLVLFAVLVGACGAVFGRMFSAAFSGGLSPRAAKAGSRMALRSPGVPRAARGGAGRSVLAAVTHPGSSAVRAKARAGIATTWRKAAAANWLEQQRAGRKNGTANGQPHAPSGAAGTATATKPALRQRLKLGLFTPAQPSPAGGGSSNGQLPPDVCPQCGIRTRAARGQPCAFCAADGGARAAVNGPAGNGNNGSGGASQPAVQGTGGPPARQSPARPAPASPPSINGGNPVAPSTAGAEQLIEGINRIHAEAAAGGIRHKQAALKSANEASLRFSSMAQMISRTMSEPGNNYGPEITEPLGQAAQHLQAAAMAFGESDTALTSLIHMTVGELADSPRQAPHHSELTETGRH